MGVEAVIATQVIDTTSVGRSLMTAADAEAARTALSLGTLAMQSGTISDYLTTVTAEATYQTILVSGTSIKTVNGSSLLGSGDLTVSGLSGTGSVDNAALRADGTGGATLQNSAWIINDNLTASPNNTVNHACFEATGGTTNVSVSIKPKGSGAFCLAAPDGTATGGNARGANANDLQRSRSAAIMVASGQTSVLLGGANNSATGQESIIVGGVSNSATQTQSYVGWGQFNTASGQLSEACGSSCTASALLASAKGSVNTASAQSARARGENARADRFGMTAKASGQFAANGDAQSVKFTLRRKTTDATATTLMLDGSTTRLTIPSGKILFADVLVSGIKSDGSAASCYNRKVAIKNVGGTTALVGSVETVGTDIEDNASTDVAITADNTNDALQIAVTGIAAETWRWVAVVEGLEIAYGT